MKQDIFNNYFQDRGIKIILKVFVAILVLTVLILGGYYYYAKNSSENSKGLVRRVFNTFPTTKEDSDIPTPQATPTPRPTGPGTYACSPSGVCNEYDDPEKEVYGCPLTFADQFCLDSCDEEENRCLR